MLTAGEWLLMVVGGHSIPVTLGGIATVGALGLAAAAAEGNNTRDDAKGKQHQAGNPSAA